MKKIIFTFLAMLTLTLDVSAQGVEIYNGNTNVASYFGTTIKTVLNKTDEKNTITVYKGSDVVATYQADASNSYTAVLKKQPSLYLDKTYVTMRVGDDGINLTATTSYSTTVTWSSSDETVATVSGGTVHAVAEGTAIITASATIGGKPATAYCTVAVSKFIPDYFTVNSSGKKVQFMKTSIYWNGRSGSSRKSR